MMQTGSVHARSCTDCDVTGRGLPTAWEAVALASLVALGYANIVTSYFLADDFLLIHTVLDGEGRPDWTVALTHLYKTQYVETLRPLVTLIHTIAYALWGATPTGYHLLNLGFHLVNGFLLYSLVYQFGRHPSRLLAFFAAAVFLTHPVHPEAVTYIGSLPGLACTTFYLLALRFALRYTATSSCLPLVFGLGSFLLALAAKEEAVSLPLMVGLLALALPACSSISSRPWMAIRGAIPFFALLALYFGYRLLIFGHITPVWFRGVNGTPIDVLRGLGSFITRLISPVNVDYAHHFGSVVFVSVFAVWDDTRHKLLRLADLDSKPPLYEAHGGDLWDWQRSQALGYTRLSATIGGLHVGGPGEFIATSGVDLATSEAAFFLLTMRAMGASSSYARLSWKRAPDEPGSASGQAFVILPDGYWHTYAVPLHTLASWQGAQRVRYLRLEPVLSEGWVEIRSVRIIAAPH